MSSHLDVMCTKRILDRGGSSESSTVQDETLANLSTSPDVLLPTLRVTLKGNRTEKTARAIIDTGSQRSYILHSTAMEMEYEQSRREFFRHSLFGGSSTDVVEHEVYTIHLSDINNSYRCEFEALGQPLFCGSIPPVCPRSFLEGSEELDVSDLMRDRIEVLTGAEIAGRLLNDDKKRISSGLMAIRTKLGWILTLSDNTFIFGFRKLVEIRCNCISDAEVEKKTQSLQAEMEEHFAHTTTRDIEGRYEVALPWVQEKERIPTNRELDKTQLSSVRRKLEEVGDMKEYGEIFVEWMNQEIIERAKEDKLDGVHYLPHRPVYKRKSQTSRIRPVFNASARKRGGKKGESKGIKAAALKHDNGREQSFDGLTPGFWTLRTPLELASPSLQAGLVLHHLRNPQEWTSRKPQWIPKPQRNPKTSSCPRATPNGYRGRLTLQRGNHLHIWVCLPPGNNNQAADTQYVTRDTNTPRDALVVSPSDTTRLPAAPDRETLFSLIESFVKGVKNENLTRGQDVGHRHRRNLGVPDHRCPASMLRRRGSCRGSTTSIRSVPCRRYWANAPRAAPFPSRRSKNTSKNAWLGTTPSSALSQISSRTSPPQDGAQLEEPISSNAVWHRLLKMGNTTPGPDGISYQGLRRVDPNATILTQIFQACFQMGAVPPSWKENSSILLHKKGDAEDLGNWRPIALGNTTAKLYTAVLADRLRRWAATTGQLSKAQKGFMEFEGCLEHNFVVQSTIEETKRPANTLASPDWILKMHSARTPLGTTSPIPFKRGVKQGCSGSPTLFNVAIEVIVRTLASMAKDHGVCLLGHYLSVLAYADDLLIMAKNKESLQALLDTTGDLAGKIGLHFKGLKCATLHLGCRKKEDYSAHDLLHPRTANLSNERRGHGTKEDVEKFHSSLLAPWKEIDATKTFIYPRLDFILRGSPIHKTAFREVNLLIKRLGKKWLGLPQRASNEVLYIPPFKGGAGMVPFGDRTDLAKIKHAFRLLTSSDSETSALAKSLLKRVAERKLGRPALEEDLAAYLSGKLDGDFARDGGDITSLWSDARNASRRLSKSIGVQWVHNPTLGGISIKLLNSGKTPKEISLPAVARGQIMARLRQALQDSYLKTLIKKPDKGKVYEVTCQDNSSNGFINSGRYMRFADWRFIHRARLNVLPLNGAKRFGPEDKRCRVCGQVDETLPHVLQHCRKHSAAVNKRHHNIVERLKKATRLQGRTRINQRVPEVSSNLRRDIVVTEEERKRITIIDEAIPFENRLVAFKDAREREISNGLFFFPKALWRLYAPHTTESWRYNHSGFGGNSNSKKVKEEVDLPTRGPSARIRRGPEEDPFDSYVKKTTLHIFCDASQFAYATCIFLRIEKQDRMDIQLIQDRTRVAPLKKLTNPIVFRARR
ncbi:hypothetical protein LAZ67_23000037 [Cordylochernes scorpioides]|uniref:Reverse transcriptase domain-containing protein n=1 Tax=Cordylochernes scorpioides TaxID=51811 RepID=A0ABY6LS49_9ARAC|nr:hypothetical protein LAZ67_23000037 [Cordylochernes scorpioides]